MADVANKYPQNVRGNFTWMINALIAIFAGRRHLQILPATMTVVTPMCISNRRTPEKRACAKRLWRDVPWKPLAATEIVNAVPRQASKLLVFVIEQSGRVAGWSFLIMPSSFRRRVIEEWRGLPEPDEKVDRTLSIREVLDQLAPKLGLEARLREEEIVSVWVEIVGDFFGRHSRPVSCIRGF